MDLLYTPAIPLLFFAGAISGVAAVLSWYNRQEPGGQALLGFNLALVFGLPAYGLYLASEGQAPKQFWIEMTYLAWSVAGAAWIYFSIRYTGTDRWASRRTIGLLLIVPTVLFIAVVVPPAKDLLYRVPTNPGAGSITGDPGAGAGPLIVLFIGYFLVTFVIASVLFVRLFVRARHLYRTQATAVLVAATAPWAGTVLTASGVAESIDPTTLALPVSGLAMSLALTRFRMLDPVPAAHDTIVEEMGDGVLVLDADDRIGDANPAALDLFDFDRESVVGSDVETVVQEWDRIESVDNPSAWHEVELNDTGAADSTFVEVQVSPFENFQGDLVGRLVVLRDVTTRKRREQQLARYETVFETVHDRVFVLDGDGRFTMVNEPFADMVGANREDLIGRHFGSILEESDTVPSLDENPVEVYVDSGDGSTIPGEVSCAPIEFEETQGTVGYLRDISRRKETERDLAETSGTLQTIVEASPLAIISTDKAGRVQRWNPAATEIFGFDPETVIGTKLEDLGNNDQINDIFERVLGGERVTGVDVSLSSADGTRIETSVSAAPQFDAAGDIHGVVAIVADVTERKEQERQLRRQNERLEEFASVVSHDLRNPLQVAKGSAQLALETDDFERVEEVEAMLERMEDIIDDMLTMARTGQQLDDVEMIDVGAVARDAWQNVDTGDATLEGSLDLTVEGDRNRVTQLFENLFRNAVEHGSGSSTQQVEATAEREGARDETTPGDGVVSDVREASSVVVEIGTIPGRRGFYVADDGPGLPEEDREDLFEAGFTTAEEGTGFGLSIVETVADAHDWSARATESRHGGARFEISVGEPFETA